MADNITRTDGNPVSTDDVGGVHFQRIKLDIGGDGVSTPVPGDAAYGVDTDVTRIAVGAGKTLGFAAINATTLGDTTLVAATAGLRIKVVSYVIITDGIVDVTWFSGAAGTALSGPLGLGAGGSLTAISQPFAPILQTAVGAALVLNLSAAIQTSGHLSYFTEA